MKMEIFPKKSKTVKSSVTESKLVLLTSRQANKLRDEFLGAKNSDFIQKPRTLVPGPISPELEFRLLLY